MKVLGDLRGILEAPSLKLTAAISDLHAAILTYLVDKGFTRSVKAFEKEASTKVGTSGTLERAWKSLQL